MSRQLKIQRDAPSIPLGSTVSFTESYAERVPSRLIRGSNDEASVGVLRSYDRKTRGRLRNANKESFMGAVMTYREVTFGSASNRSRGVRVSRFYGDSVASV